MRYYLGQCEYKCTHADTNMEHIWVRRELGEELFEQCNQDGFNLDYVRTDSVMLPGDAYCCCNIYVELPNNKQATLFALKFSNAKKVERV